MPIKQAVDSFEFPQTEGLEVVLVGLNHKCADVSLREQLSFTPEKEKDFLHAISYAGVLEEIVVFSTCNRSEVVAACASSNVSAVKSEIEKLLAIVSGLNQKDFLEKLYELKGGDAIEHLFKVASGLDSMVLGEPQITGQVKKAYYRAYEAGKTGAVLNRLFHRAFGVTKQIRTHTAIGRRAVSVSYAAKELAIQIFGSLEKLNVMLVGAGETGALTSKHLKSAGVKDFIVANRTLSSAVELADELGAVAIEVSKVEQYLERSDVVIGAASVDLDNKLVTAEMVKASLKARQGKPQFFIDLGVPRNFDEKIDQLSDSFLYSIDDLEQVVKDNIGARCMELERAELIIDQEVQRFLHWKNARAIEPAIREVIDHLDELAQQEVEKTMKRLRRAGFAASQNSELNSAISAMAKSIAAKFLHVPISQLKKESQKDRKAAEKFLLQFLNLK